MIYTIYIALVMDILVIEKWNNKNKQNRSERWDLQAAL